MSVKQWQSVDASRQPYVKAQVHYGCKLASWLLVVNDWFFVCFLDLFCILLFWGSVSVFVFNENNYYFITSDFTLRLQTFCKQNVVWQSRMHFFGWLMVGSSLKMFVLKCHFVFISPPFVPLERSNLYSRIIRSIHSCNIIRYGMHAWLIMHENQCNYLPAKNTNLSSTSHVNVTLHSVNLSTPSSNIRYSSYYYPGPTSLRP